MLNSDDQAFEQAGDKIIDDLALKALEIYGNNRDQLRELLSTGRVDGAEENATKVM